MALGVVLPAEVFMSEFLDLCEFLDIKSLEDLNDVLHHIGITRFSLNRVYISTNIPASDLFDSWQK